MGLFFFDQSGKIEKWHSNQCAQSSYTNEEKQAGFQEISEQFGFLATLHQLSEGDIQKENEIVKESVFRIYQKIQLLSHYSSAQRRHGDILRRKK